MKLQLHSLSLVSGFHYVRRFITKHPIITTLIIVILGYTLYAMYAKNTQPKPARMSPVVEDLRQVVVASGQVTPTQDATLSFQESGKVASLNVNVGDTVTEGQVLARLEGSDVSSGILSAQANVNKAQADLDKLVAGPRKEEVAQKTQVLTNAQDSLATFTSTLFDSLQTTNAVLTSSVRSNLSSAFTLSDGRYILKFSTCDSSRGFNVEQARLTFETNFLAYQKDSLAVSSASDSALLEKTFLEAYTISKQGASLVDSLASLLALQCSVTDTSLDTLRTVVATSRTSVSAQVADLASKSTTLTTLKNAVASANQDLLLLQSGSDSNTIESQNAQVDALKALLSTAQSRASKIILVAPFSGVITSRSITIGQTVSPTTPAISLISSSGFQTEVKVPETDIAKVAVGNDVEVKLDAYGPDRIFAGTVTRIDPVATFQGSVPTYNVVVSFKEKSEAIRGGMTAEVKIITQVKKATLSLPLSYISAVSGTEGSVNLVSGTKVTSHKVTLGIHGDNGYIEIVSGLTASDIVEIQSVINGGAQKNTSANSSQ